jgi:hypothetical protein
VGGDSRSFAQVVRSKQAPVVRIPLRPTRGWGQSGTGPGRGSRGGGRSGRHGYSWHRQGRGRVIRQEARFEGSGITR